MGAPGAEDSERLRLSESRAPRYTSYPTALEFSAGIGPAEVMQEIHRTNQEPIPAPLSLYLHLPFCAAAGVHCGCHSFACCSAGGHAGYLKLLEQEIDLVGAQFADDRPVLQIHLGGGTANRYPPEALERLVAALHRQFSISPACEISIEVDPRQVRPGDAFAWVALGFNRLSLGLQDVDRGVQRTTNRIQPKTQVAELVAAAREGGITGIDFELIEGLPELTLATVEKNLALVERLRPERVAVFYAGHLPARFSAQRAIDSTQPPDGAAWLATQRRYADALVGLGYRHIGLDHFAMPHDSLARALAEGSLQRNFQGYSTVSGSDTLGLGVSAISSIGRLYAQNHSRLPAYRAALEMARPAIARGHRCSDDDRLRHTVIQQIMCRQPLDFARLLPTGRFEDHFAAELDRLRQLDPDGRLVRVTAAGLVIQPAGEQVLRLIARCFDRYAVKRAGDELARAVCGNAASTRRTQ